MTHKPTILGPLRGTLEEIEAELDDGRVFALMHNGNYWRVRRNGATRRWITRPGHFRIQVKAGLRSYAEITHENFQLFMVGE